MLQMDYVITQANRIHQPNKDKRKKGKKKDDLENGVKRKRRGE